MQFCRSNPKHEIRNKFKARMSKNFLNHHRFEHLKFEFMICFGFRASDFGFKNRKNGQVIDARLLSVSS